MERTSLKAIFLTCLALSVTATSNMAYGLLFDKKLNVGGVVQSVVAIQPSSSSARMYFSEYSEDIVIMEKTGNKTTSKTTQNSIYAMVVVPGTKLILTGGQNAVEAYELTSEKALIDKGKYDQFARIKMGINSFSRFNNNYYVYLLKTTEQSNIVLAGADY